MLAALVTGRCSGAVSMIKIYIKDCSGSGCVHDTQLATALLWASLPPPLVAGLGVVQQSLLL